MRISTNAKYARWFNRTNPVGNMGYYQKVNGIRMAYAYVIGFIWYEVSTLHSLCKIDDGLLNHRSFRDENWKWVDSDKRTREFQYDLVTKNLDHQ